MFFELDDVPITFPLFYHLCEFSTLINYLIILNYCNGLVYFIDFMFQREKVMRNPDACSDVFLGTSVCVGHEVYFYIGKWVKRVTLLNVCFIQTVGNPSRS